MTTTTTDTPVQPTTSTTMNAQSELEAFRGMVIKRKREHILSIYDWQTPSEGLQNGEASPIDDWPERVQSDNPNVRNRALDEQARRYERVLTVRADIEGEGYTVEQAVMWQAWAYMGPVPTTSPSEDDPEACTVHAMMRANGLVKADADGLWVRQTKPPGVHRPHVALAISNIDMDEFDDARLEAERGQPSPKPSVPDEGMRLVVRPGSMLDVKDKLWNTIQRLEDIAIAEGIDDTLKVSANRALAIACGQYTETSDASKFEVLNKALEQKLREGQPAIPGFPADMSDDGLPY